jgi:uncharacterized radical SAM protein YgiQ
LPTTLEQVSGRGWSGLDIVFISGDAYVDHPAFGVPLLARLLESRGFRVGIIPQPDWRTKEPFAALGRPELFFAVSAGAMDSMVAHYTPAKKLRRDDAYTPGNRHGARPNRATIIYVSRLKEAFKDVPVVIGGIEASLRRFAHYDYWDDRVRRSLLFDSKADLLVYGMGERPLLELAERMRRGESLSDLRDIRGTCFIMPAKDRGFVGESAREIPSCEQLLADKSAFGDAYRLAAAEMNPFNAVPVVQGHGDRLLVCNPPSFPLSGQELDAVYSLPFAKQPHPSYLGQTIPAFEQIKSSITSHRGCAGGCAFCAIAHHQGKIVQSRSEASIIAEIEKLVAQPWFAGTITDIGGPSANMYGMSCGNRKHLVSCRRQSCLNPDICKHLKFADDKSASLLRKTRAVRGVKHSLVASGVRFELFDRQPQYFSELIGRHVGGLLKVAPEHFVDKVTSLMGKPGRTVFLKFLEEFRRESSRVGKRQYLIPYLMSGHPGSTLADMAEAALVLKRTGLRVEQVQDFTPTPGTLATCMYYTGINPYTKDAVYSARSDKEKRLQKSLLLYCLPGERRYVIEALKSIGREDIARELVHGDLSDRHSAPRRRSVR